MRYKISFFFLLFFNVLSGQIVQDFEQTMDSLWLQEPSGRWGIDTTNPIAGSGSLRHLYDNAEAGNDRISYPLSNLNVDSGMLSFRMKIRHGYSPSSSNRWGVFLFADQPAAEMKQGGAIHGYVLGVNFSGSDDLLKLWKTDAGDASVVIQTSLNWQEKVGIAGSPALQVLRHPGGFWTVLADTGRGSMDTLGTGKDDSFCTSGFFGLSYQYTSSKDRLLWLDALCIQGSFIIDSVPPDLQQINLVSSNQLDLLFNEPLQSTGASFAIHHPLVLPDSFRIEGAVCHLFFSESMTEDQDLYLYYAGVEDMNGNIALPDSMLFNYHRVKAGDVLINELMADPSPEVGLPDAEYIELYNASGWAVSIKGWQLSAGKSSWVIPDVQLEPYGFLLITSASSVDLFQEECTTLGLLSASGSLSNNGSSVVLRNEYGGIISAVQYDLNFYDNVTKQNGGWSLERVDPACFCVTEGNWRASEAVEGGTPGAPNSVLGMLTDTVAPVPLQIAPMNDSTLLLIFSETPDSNNACNASNYLINPDIGVPACVIQNSPLGREFSVSVTSPFQEGVLYTFTIMSGIKDCTGNINDETLSLPFTLAEEPDSLDILFSEILYDVPAEGAEFLEIYNHSGRIVEISGMRIATLQTGSYEIQSSTTISNDPRLFFPEEYLVLTEWPQRLEALYDIQNPSALLEVPGMPSLSNEGGCAVLMRKDGKIIDKACWSDEMHHALLENTRGISLERTSFEGSSLQTYNWHSAASLAGWATPGYENSQETQTGINDERVKVTPELISPDNDGKDDYASILFNTDNPGWTACVQIYDMSGRLVRELVNNQLTGTEGRINWDGLDNRGIPCYNGIYIIRVMLYNLKGGYYESKKVCMISIR